MRYYLTAISVEGFRGINNSGSPLSLTFPSGKVTSVFAENARGKSSIFQALQYALCGKVPHLQILHRDEEGNRYYCNQFHPTKTATISLQLESDQPNAIPQRITVTRDAQNTRTVLADPPMVDPESLLASLAADHFLLDASRFHKFVEDSPLDRGRSFSELLGLQTLSEARQALESLANPTNFNRDFGIPALTQRRTNGATERARAQTRMRDLAGRIIGHIPLADLTPAGARELVHGKLLGMEPLAGLLPDSPNVRPDFGRLRDALKVEEQSQRQARLTTLLTKREHLDQFRASPTEPDERTQTIGIATDLEDALRKTRGPEYLATIRAAHRLLASPEWDTPNDCPVCGNESDENLALRLELHLEAYTNVEKLNFELGNAIQAADWYRCALALLGDEDIAATSSERHALNAFAERLRFGQLTISALKDAFEPLDSMRVRLCELIDKLVIEHRALAESMPASLVDMGQSAVLAEELFDATRSLEALISQEQTVAAQLDARERWRNFVTRASEVFGSAEAALSTAKMLTLRATYQDFYDHIVPGGDVVPRLVKGSGTEELHLTLERFHGVQDIPAPAVLSESYRNALAISVYLSAALESVRPARFLVLDDVTSSLDAGHQQLLVDLLLRRVSTAMRPDGLQIILLSHDQTLAKYFTKMSQERVWKAYQLTGAPPAGPVMLQGQGPDTLRARADALVRSGDSQAGGPLVRQYLEARLIQTIEKLRIPVQYDVATTDESRTIGRLLDSIVDCVRLNKAAGRLILTESQEQDLVSVVVPTILGNLTSHYSSAASMSLAPAVLLGALGRVDDFVACFTYECRCDGATRMRLYKNVTAKDCPNC